MSLIKLVTATTLATAFMLVAMPSIAGAQTMSQEQEMSTNANVSVNCTTGAYGQSSTCSADANASATGRQAQRMDGQRIVYRADGTAVVVHDVVNTGVDMNTVAAAAGTMLTGSIAAVLKIKNRVA